MEYKLKYRLLFCALFALFLAEFGFSEERIHVMQRGETIYSIARSYGANVQEVLNLNRITDATTVQAGQRIRIPGTNTTLTAAPVSGAVPVSSPGYDEYLVERNDTLYSLARRYGTTVPELLDLNGFASNYVLKAGEKIRVPSQQLAAGQPVGPVPVVQNPPPVSGTAAPARIDPSIRWPIRAKEISYITGRMYGVQITGERQEAIRSLTGGTVVSAMPYRGFGRVAIVQSPQGYLYVYGGCDTLSVKEGDKITSGTELGKLGIDARSAKPQLFFFVYRGNTAIDPARAPRV